MPKIRVAGDVTLGGRLVGVPHPQALFVALMKQYRPFLWWQFNDIPAGGIVLDSAVPSGLVPAPEGPPHNANWPASVTNIPGATSDGRRAAQWNGVYDPAHFAQDGSDDMPAFVSLLWAMKCPTGVPAGAWVFSLQNGNAVQLGGPGNITFNIGSYGLNYGVFYLGGTIVNNSVADHRLADGNWHLLGLDLAYDSGTNTINMTPYADGLAISAPFNINPNGLNWFDEQPNGVGWAMGPGNGASGDIDPANAITSVQVQDFAAFGAGLAPWGGRLLAADYAALYAAWKS